MLIYKVTWRIRFLPISQKSFSTIQAADEYFKKKIDKLPGNSSIGLSVWKTNTESELMFIKTVKYKKLKTLQQ